jgi:uncharacterized phage protein gp47/JayE
MSFAAPTFQEIHARILADIDAKMEADGSTRGVVEYALAFAQAGACMLLFAAIDRAARNKVPTTATDAVKLLWATFFGIDRKPATYNTGEADFDATAGSTIPAGTTLRLRNGVEFATDSLATESGGSIHVAFTATNTGLAGRSSSGTAIFLGSPVAGVNSEGVVDTDGISGGTDIETVESVYARLLTRLRTPPKGGTEADFEAWTRATEGVDVDGVWVRPNELGPSSVKVLFTTTADDPIPIGGEPTLVTAYLETKAPVDLLTVQAIAPTPQTLDPDIQLSPNTADVRAAVTAAIKQLLRDEAVPGETLLLSHINEAISGATGEVDHVLVSPVADVVPGDSDTLIVIGTPSYSSL